MKKIAATDVLDLSIPERIQLVEDIWDTIAANAEAVDLSDDDKQIIDQRLDAYHKDPDIGSPWNEVLKRATNIK